MRQKISDILNKNHNILILHILLAFCLYLPIFVMNAYGDDLTEIINSWHLRTAPNVFSFWNPKSDYYKSWSLSYSVLYILKYIFGNKLIFYKAFNVLLHAFSGFLLFKVLEKLTALRNKALGLSLVFLCHPLAVETLVNSFQIKTTLSIFFFLLSTLCILNGYLLRSLALFTFSLLSKSTFILIPLIGLFFIKKLNKVFILACLLISFFLGLNHLKGSSPNNRTLYLKDHYQEQLTYDHFLRDKNLEINQQDLESSEDIVWINAKKTLSNIFDYKKLSLKLTYFSHSMVQFILKAFGISQYWPIYPQIQVGTWFINLSLFITVFILIWMFYTKRFRHSFTVFLLTFIPVSGVIYVTNIVFSPLSDHWFYPCLLGFLYLLTNIRFPKYCLGLMTIVLLSQNIYTQTKYLNLEQLFKANLEKAPKSIILREFLTQLNINNPQVANKYFQEILELDPYNENTLIQAVKYFRIYGMDDYPLLKRYFILKYYQNDYYMMDKMKEQYPKLLKDPDLKDYL